MGAIAELLSGARPSFLPTTATATHAQPVAKSRVHSRHASPRHVINASLFRDALTKERKRAERFDQPFMVVLVSANPGVAAEPANWLPAIEALQSITGDTDVLGWFERGTTLGVIVPEIGTDP